MKKIIISKLFLYKHRFVIGYILLGLAFVSLIFVLPFIAQKGLSEAEMSSAVSSYNLEPDAIFHGDLVNIPYRILQKFSIAIFGLTPFAIKLPSIVIGLILGFLLILILNRWFKNNVSLLASVVTILSTPFLFLAGTGTPLIMLVFWPALLLWLGSKIQGEKQPEPIFCFAFAFVLLLSLFTPYMIYFALFIVAFVLSQPHLRFVIKTLPKVPLLITGLIVIGGITVLTMNAIQNHVVIKELLLAKNFSFHAYLNNLGSAFTPVFSWNHSAEGTLLSPLISLPVFALIMIGLFSTTKGFFASRNAIAVILLIFTVAISGLDPEAVIFITLPIAILVAHGLKYVLEKWYGLFPENPYARIFALLPLTIFISLVLIPGVSQYVYGYHYNPIVANNYSNNLQIIRKNLSNETILAKKDSLEYKFYKILEDSTDLKIVDEVNENVTGNIAALERQENGVKGRTLTRIITSEKSNNSDIIYLYTVEGE